MLRFNDCSLSPSMWTRLLLYLLVWMASISQNLSNMSSQSWTKTNNCLSYERDVWITLSVPRTATFTRRTSPPTSTKISTRSILQGKSEWPISLHSWIRHKRARRASRRSWRACHALHTMSLGGWRSRVHVSLNSHMPHCLMFADTVVLLSVTMTIFQNTESTYRTIRTWPNQKKILGQMKYARMTDCAEKLIAIVRFRRFFHWSTRHFRHR